MKTLKKGIFVTFEGPEGSGKSTQSKLLCNFLKSSGFDVLHFREPGGTDLGELIRKILLNSKDTISPISETLLYIASRAQLVSKKIKPALWAKKIVICDRFADATLVYQGYGLGLNKDIIKRFNNFATENIKPDITFVLDVQSRTGLIRSKKTKGFKDRIEKRPLSFHEKVRKGYLEIAKMNPRRIKVYSVQKNPKQKIQRLIQKAVIDVIRRYSK